jgi:hypothetical protein
MYQAYLVWANSRRRFIMSKIHFGRTMGEYFAESGVTIRKRIGGELERAWKMRTLDGARKYFDEQAGTAGKWPETDEFGAELPLE